MTEEKRGGVRTKELFSFELDLGEGEDRPEGQRLEDLVYNCLDFCILYDRQPHFHLAGPDALGHPALWRLLEILREEGSGFSLLSGPEQACYESSCAARLREDPDRILVDRRGEASCCGRALGCAMEDRLADLWACAWMGKERQ